MPEYTFFDAFKEAGLAPGIGMYRLTFRQSSLSADFCELILTSFDGEKFCFVGIPAIPSGKASGFLNVCAAHNLDTGDLEAVLVIQDLA